MYFGLSSRTANWAVSDIAEISRSRFFSFIAVLAFQAEFKRTQVVTVRDSIASICITYVGCSGNYIAEVHAACNIKVKNLIGFNNHVSGPSEGSRVTNMNTNVNQVRRLYASM